MLINDVWQNHKELFEGRIIVTDPPFNIGYHYDEYQDKVNETIYYNELAEMIKLGLGAVIIHYPEQLHRLSIEIGKAPDKVISWVYNSNTPKQHRDIAFYGVTPIRKQVLQPYKNPNDKRIKERIAKGFLGTPLYDWFNINQVKNVSKEKTDHPCQMPLEVMENIIGILPIGSKVIDPFAGSGTTLLACKNKGYNYIGIELSNDYCKIIKDRLEK